MRELLRAVFVLCICVAWGAAAQEAPISPEEPVAETETTADSAAAAPTGDEAAAVEAAPPETAAATAAGGDGTEGSETVKPFDRTIDSNGSFGERENRVRVGFGRIGWLQSGRAGNLDLARARCPVAQLPGRS